MASWFWNRRKRKSIRSPEEEADLRKKLENALMKSQGRNKEREAAEARKKEELRQKWAVPGWELDRYIASGAYGHTFLGRNGKKKKVVKVYDLSSDAIIDLRKVFGLPEDYTPDQYIAALEKAIAKEWMSGLRRMASIEEKRVILLPEKVIPGVKSRDGAETLAAISRPLERILEDELNKGLYREPEEYIPLIKQIIRALAVVHKKRLNTRKNKYERRVHGDIKPSNIGVEGWDTAVLLDFGIATTICSHYVDFNYPNIMSLQLRAPEILPDSPHPTPRSDVWQMGCLIANIATRKAPFKYSDRPRKGFPGRSTFEMDELPRRIEKDIPRVLKQMKRAGAPRKIIEIARRCFSVEEEGGGRRYGHAEELLKAFDEKMHDFFYGEGEGKYLEAELKEKARALDLDADQTGDDITIKGLNSGVFDKMCGYRVFPLYKSGISIEPLAACYSESIPPQLITATASSENSVGEMHRFLDTYNAVQEFRLILEKLGETKEYWKMEMEDIQEKIDEIRTREEISADFVVRVGIPNLPHGDHENMKRFSERFKEITEENKSSHLSLFVANNGGYMANPGWWESMRHLGYVGGPNDILRSMRAKTPPETFPVYAIAKADDVRVAVDAAEELLAAITHPAITKF